MLQPGCLGETCPSLGGAVVPVRASSFQIWNEHAKTRPHQLSEADLLPPLSLLHVVGMRTRGRFGLALAWMLACSQSDDHTPARRQLDTIRLQQTLPPDRAEAFFALNTGGDQLTTRSKEAGLVVVVRFGDREIRQTIATCSDPALGSALGGGGERELEVAMCNGEYRLISEPGVVQALRVDAQGANEVVASVRLPAAGLRAVKPDSR